MTSIRRIALIGSPGSGKSTLAREIGVALGLPVYHLDRLYHRPGWVQTPRAEWVALQEELVGREEWIIDGNYRSTLPLRVNAADAIIFLDLPRLVCLWRVVRRTFQYRNRSRPDMAEGCPERLNREFLSFVWGYPERDRPAVLRLLEKVAAAKRVIHLRSRTEVAAFRRRLESGEL